MTLHTKDSALFQLGKDSLTTHVSRFSGLPLGVELNARWLVKDFQFWHEPQRPGAAANTEGADWTVTVVGTGTLALSDDLTPPRLVLANSAADNDSVEAQFTAATGAGEAFALRANKRLYFRTQFSLTDANNNAATITETDLFLGLAITDTTMIGGLTDYIGFFKPDGSAVVRFVAGKNSTTLGDQITTNVLTLTTANAGTTEAALVTLEFLVVGTTKVYVYVNGNYFTTVNSTTQLPDDEQLCPAFALQNGEAVIKQMHLTQLLYVMER